MYIAIITAFPDACRAYLDASIVGRARRRGLIDVDLVDPRAWAGGRHRRIDDRPYGGGPGMVMMAPPLAACIDHLQARHPGSVLLMTSPQGAHLDQARVDSWRRRGDLIILCGHYEGIDERIAALYRPELISIGDLVISGGELAALVVVDAVTRLLPGALGNGESARQDSFADEGNLDHPCYTRPREFRDLEVPAALRSGDHQAIDRHRAAERERRSQAPR